MYRRYFEDSQASKSVRPTIDRMRKEFQQQVSAQEQRLRQAEQELARQRAILAPEAFAQKRREFSDQARQAQANVQQRRRDLDRAFNGTKNEILKSLIVVAQGNRGREEAQYSYREAVRVPVRQNAGCDG